MENTKENAAVENSAAGENPNPNVPASESASEAANPKPNGNPPSRTPFTSLGQVDADLVLSRALQEQERAYMMLRMDSVDERGYGSSDSGSYVYEDELEGDEDDDDHHQDHGTDEGSDYGEGAFVANEDEHELEANEEELNPADFESDEAFAGR